MKNTNRRSFFKVAFATLIGLPLLGKEALAAAACKPAPAPTTGKVIDEKTMKRLDYVADATKSTNKKYKAGSNCANCRWYKDHSKPWAKCSMAANKQVSACGWCKQWKELKKA